MLIYKYLHLANFQSIELEIGAHSVGRVLAAVTDRPLMGTARPFHISHDMTSEHQRYWKPAAKRFLLL